jgi:protein subunit release factor B
MQTASFWMLDLLSGRPKTLPSSYRHDTTKLHGNQSRPDVPAADVMTAREMRGAVLEPRGRVAIESKRRARMMTFGVSPEKEAELRERMDKLGIRSEDIIEKFVRSGGHGGQNVNKVSTCVYLKHVPTGIEVKCQKERSQALNRFFARRLLVEKIEAMVLGEESAERQRIEKIRRQKRKRSRRAKEKMLAEKRQRAEKKKTRASVTPDAE